MSWIFSINERKPDVTDEKYCNYIFYLVRLLSLIIYNIIIYQFTIWYLDLMMIILSKFYINN